MNIPSPQVGINEETHFPEIAKYESLLNEENPKIIELINAIRQVDRKALSFLYVKNPDNKKYKRKKSIIPQYEKLIYQCDHTVYSENSELSQAFKKILKILIDDIRLLLQEWDKEKSGHNEAKRLGLIDEEEKNIEKIQESFSPQIIDQNIFEKEAAMLIQAMDNKEEIQKLKNALIDFGKPSLTTIISNTGEKVGKTLTKAKEFGNTIFNKETFYRYWYLYIMSIIATTSMGEKVINLADGHHKEISELIEIESDKNGEGERKYQIIESEIMPVIAEHLRKINTRGLRVDWNDYNNNIFFFGIISELSGESYILTPQKERIDDIITGSKACIQIDVADAPNYGMFSPSKIETWENKRLENDLLVTDTDRLLKKGTLVNGQITEKECELGKDSIANMGLGESTDFMLKILNHPDTIKNLKNASEKIVTD